MFYNNITVRHIFVLVITIVVFFYECLFQLTYLLIKEQTIQGLMQKLITELNIN